MASMMTDDMPRGAERMVKNLEHQIEMDEPEAFVREAIKAIENQDDDRWGSVLNALRKLEAELTAANEPPAA